MDTEHEGHEEPVQVASFGTRGEAEVAEAKLRAYGIDSSVDDVIEGGAIPIEGEPSVSVFVRPGDAADALRILATGDEATGDEATGDEATDG